MKILIAGSNGFLGKTLCELLCKDYTIITLDLSGADINCNIAITLPELSYHKTDIVLHVAGKAHSIPKNDEESKVFFDVNLHGTKNICSALEKSGIPKSFIFISTVAVYGEESGEMITEDHPLNGNSPYAASKIDAEKFLIKWCDEHNVILTILRPSLIAGPNPPGNLGQMISGIKSGKYLSIGGGKARKSTLMVQDIANIVPLVVDKGGIYNVCDSEHPTFRDLEKIISQQLNKKLPINIPYLLATLLATLGDLMGNKAPINSEKLKKLTKSLTFSNEKIIRETGWEPLKVIDHFIIK